MRHSTASSGAAGCTLIELISVIGIIGLLSAVALLPHKHSPAEFWRAEGSARAAAFLGASTWLR